MYPGAVFLTSYEAGKGQRFYLYGSAAGYTELVAYYRTLLKQRGTAVFESPATHIFEVGKYDENAMAFPPSVTIKDYASGGNGGYLNPKPGPSPRALPHRHSDRADSGDELSVLARLKCGHSGSQPARRFRPDSDVSLRQLGSEDDARPDEGQEVPSIG